MISTISLKSYLVNACLDQRRRRMHASYDRLDGTMLFIVMIMIDDGEDDDSQKYLHIYVHTYIHTVNHHLINQYIQKIDTVLLHITTQ
jgi:hypothetical protein